MPHVPPLTLVYKLLAGRWAFALGALAALALLLQMLAAPPVVVAAGCVSAGDCVAKMTLDEKIGQMTQVANTYLTTPSDVRTQTSSARCRAAAAAGRTARAAPPRSGPTWSIATRPRRCKPGWASRSWTASTPCTGTTTWPGPIFPHNIGLGATRNAALGAAGRAGDARRSAGHRHPLDLCAMRVRAARRPLGPHLRGLRRRHCAGRVDGAGGDPGLSGRELDVGDGHGQALSGRRRHNRALAAAVTRSTRATRGSLRPSCARFTCRPTRPPYKMVLARSWSLQQLERRQGSWPPVPDHHRAEGRTGLRGHCRVGLGGR